MTEDTAFSEYVFLGHTHYRCERCGADFCGKDVERFYHECDDGEADP